VKTHKSPVSNRAFTPSICVLFSGKRLRGVSFIGKIKRERHAGQKQKLIT
jgi:hypothetical protein